MPDGAEATPGAAPAAEASAFDAEMMAHAVRLAREGRGKPGASPIGCVIVLDGEVIGASHNEVGIQHDPTAHAEIVAIRRACATRGSEDLRGAVLYSTLQPCGMCTMASIWAHIGRIVYGAGRADVHQMYFEDRHFDTMNFVLDAYRDDLEVVAGVAKGACADLYYRPWDRPPLDQQANL
jgi:tRNA(adenine34) deaminase